MYFVTHMDITCQNSFRPHMPPIFKCAKCTPC